MMQESRASSLYDVKTLEITTQIWKYSDRKIVGFEISRMSLFCNNISSSKTNFGVKAISADKYCIRLFDVSYVYIQFLHKCYQRHFSQSLRSLSLDVEHSLK